jgi:hypothetical protein
VGGVNARKELSMTIEKFADIYRGNGFTVDVDGDVLTMEFEGIKSKVSIDEEWKASINSFFKAKQYSFDDEKRILTSYRTVEFQVVRLDPAFLPRPDFEFSDEKGNTFKLTPATPEFVLSLFSSKVAGSALELVKRRIRRRAERNRFDKDGFIRLRAEDVLVIQHTARYCVARKISSDHLVEKGRKNIKSCLFKLAYNNVECWELRESIRASGSLSVLPELPSDASIPQATYVDDLISYYKVAKASQFPDQKYLSYYHILEYFFLRVSDEIIHTSLKSQLNSPSFNSSYENINKILSTIKRADKTADETEMLKAVLAKYVSEEDLIEFILAIEKAVGEKIYTDTKKEVFGEKATIRLEKGHALNNTAKVIKQIRNSLVHSSDNYNREDCFMPFSESETFVSQYIPIIMFLAEKVIFSTAS